MRRLLNGLPLTPELEREITEHFERGLDLRKTRTIYRADEETGASPRISTRVPPDVYSHIQGEARRRKVSVSTVVRERLARRGR